MIYNKLVRDRIPEIIRKNGGRPKFHRATRAEFERRLKAKLCEEAEELRNARTEKETSEELADVLEILEEIFRYYQFDQRIITGIQRRKARERGSFQKRIILEKA